MQFHFNTVSESFGGDESQRFRFFIIHTMLVNVECCVDFRIHNVEQKKTQSKLAFLVDVHWT